MKPLARFIDVFRDSPTYGLDRANLFSGLTIGIAGLLLNGAVLMALLPILLDPNDQDLRTLNEKLQIGQLLALILMGGATGFATLLIPLRLVSVFWGPRMGRYFDQVVLSGISPLKFVIGKATSQNLFLGLILFLLLPHFVLSLALGGVDLGIFAAGVVLIWLYCMALAMVTLWLSLYLNELLAAALVIFGGAMLAGFGCIPMRFQPFVMTPAPALIYPVWASFPGSVGRIPQSFFVLFAACAGCLTAVIVVSFVAIYLGPLFGIIRDNSTFGEVVHPGDSKRKRWFRLRLHIQRPSEIAFLYENRSAAFGGNEGLIRWGAAFCGLIVLLGTFHLLHGYYTWNWLFVQGGATSYRWWVYDFHARNLTIHGFGLVLAIFVFSHARNSTYLRIPFVRGRLVEVSRLDTRAFILFALVSTTASIAVPFLLERLAAVPNSTTFFPGLMYGNEGRPVNYLRVAVEGSVSLSAAALAVYAMHRYFCLIAWLKTVAALSVAALYLFVICMIPMFYAVLFFEVPLLRNTPVLSDMAPTIAMISPFALIMVLFNEFGPPLRGDVSTVPFYVAHGLLLVLMIVLTRRRGPKLRQTYLETPSRVADA